MRWVTGVDGCKNQWLWIRKDLTADRLDSGLVDRIADLVSVGSSHDIIGIDIPIGLPDEGARACDKEARKLLRFPRSCSVFPAPSRPLLQTTSWEEASAVSRSVLGHGISKQAAAIIPKVREVDDLFLTQPELACRLREVHPEVSFWAWAGCTAMRHGKKTVAGRHERRALVNAYFGALTVDGIRGRHPSAPMDDVLDAFAALWTAERIALKQYRVLPDKRQTDSLGRPMEIAY